MLAIVKGSTLLILEVRGQRSRVKVTLDIYGNKLVNRIETKPLCDSSSNLVERYAIVGGWAILIL